MEEWIIKILISLVTAGLASWLTVRLAFKRFISEKLWEKRAEAYGAILEALHDMKRYPDGILDSYEVEGGISEDQKTKLLVSYREAAHELNRRVEVEQFFLSDDLLTEISTLNKNLAMATKLDDGYSVVDDSFDAIKDAQGRIREIAKAHLSVR